MPTNELKSLQSNLDCQIAANGLLSTSKYGSIARVFIVEVTNTSEFKVVIFQITVDASNLKNVVFVDINQYIGKADENESEKKILFNIKGVNYESESDIWIIKMEVTDENVSELKKQVDSEKTRFRVDNMNLSFGQLLLDMNRYLQPGSYFQMLL
ncbi:unnamed protein product [Rotaria magnacalcarata]